MNIFSELLSKLRGLLAIPGRLELVEQAERSAKMLRDVVMPAKAGLCLVVALYYLFYSGFGWRDKANGAPGGDGHAERLSFSSICCAILWGGVFVVFWRRLLPGLIQWLAFIAGITGRRFHGLGDDHGYRRGFASMAFWVFPGLTSC